MTAAVKASPQTAHPQYDGCDIHSIEEMYGDDHSTVTDLFPEEQQGCINFGYWPNKENMQHPISLDRRIASQRELYIQLFKDAQLSSADHVLEVGCGRGHGVAWGSERVSRYVGVDLLEKQVEKAQRAYPTLRDHFTVGSANDTKLATGGFDKVVSLEAAQHFPDFPAFTREANRVLKPDGTLSVCTFFFTDAEGEKMCKSEMPTNELALDHTITIRKAITDLEASGFQIARVRRMGKNTFHGFCTWAKQVHVTTPHTLKWVDMYERGCMDYYTIIARKV